MHLQGFLFYISIGNAIKYPVQMDYTLEELQFDWEIYSSIIIYKNNYRERMPMRNEIWEDPDPIEQKEFEEWQQEEIEKIKSLYRKSIAELEKTKTYFLGCSFKNYKHNYTDRLNDFIGKFEDATEMNFIEQELQKGIKELPYEYLPEAEIMKFHFSLNKRFEFLEDKARSFGYEVKYYESQGDPDGEYPEFFEIIPLPHRNNTHLESLQWQGGQTELMELLKALVQAGKVKGTQKEVVQRFSQFFQTEIKHPDKLLQDIKNRNNGSETLLLDHLKKTLLEYIQQ